MMSLVIDRNVVTDPYRRIAEDEPIPEHGAVLVSLAAWQANASHLRARAAPVGVLLRSDEHPEAIAEHLDRLQL
ncbi:MAG: oxidoreductase, partial [Gammaproteobacteria bacterium]|nr:oxidoreductase [Gammaproteobacteria bacterium]